MGFTLLSLIAINTIGCSRGELTDFVPNNVRTSPSPYMGYDIVTFNGVPTFSFNTIEDMLFFSDSICGKGYERACSITKEIGIDTYYNQSESFNARVTLLMETSRSEEEFKQRYIALKDSFQIDSYAIIGLDGDLYSIPNAKCLTEAIVANRHGVILINNAPYFIDTYKSLNEAKKHI